MEFTTPHLTQYLTHRLGRPVEIKDIERFSRGTSRQTWFVTIHPGREGSDEALVFRTDHATGSIEPTSLAQEYFMYERLGHTDVPVAKALWWEEDTRWTETPFYVREKVEGSWNIPHFLDPDPQYDELRIAISKEHMRKLAIVHNVDWRGLNFGERLPVPRDEASCGRLYVDTVLRQLDEVGGEGVPIMLEAAEWLKDTAPTAPRISLCKGTNGFGEEVWRGRELVAMSDWEEASIGDPAADFAFMQYLAPELERDGDKIWGLEKALDYYRSVSGIAVTMEGIRFYGAIRAMRLIIMAQKAGMAVRNAPNLAEIRQAWTGTEVGHVCKRSLIAAMGLSVPPPASVLAEFHETIEAPL
jgi:aminoglycoside phosphotransferase (APT) family kinase protein